MASSNSPEGSAVPKHDYPFPSCLNAAASFVSIKLSGEYNYVEWREQMVCLLKCHDMYGFIDGSTIPEPLVHAWRRSDTLVKGWIFGSVSEYVMSTIVGIQTAYEVWEKLQTTYNTLTPPASTIKKVNTFTVGESLESYLPLCTAIQNRDRDATQNFLFNDPDALFVVLNSDGERAIHLAIGETDPHSISFLSELLDRMEPGILPSLVNNKGQNVLHYAAMLENIAAAQVLIERNPRLLFTRDDNSYLPITTAAFHSNMETFIYLYHMCRQHIMLSEIDGYHSPFIGNTGALLLPTAIFSGLLELAYHMLKDYPELATIEVSDTMGPLLAIAQISDGYPSGKRYNFYQRFVYHYIPGREEYLSTPDQPTSTSTYMPRMVSNYMSRSRFPAYKWIYDKFWRFAMFQVRHIKHLQEDKVKHDITLLILQFICMEVGKLPLYTGHYKDALFAAMENDTVEVVEMIIKNFPQSISIRNSRGHTIFQLSIMNRCEKVYNLLAYKTRHRFLQNSIIDEEGNNLLHLAARLAPQHRLNDVSSAALKMQRELQWFQEVSRLLRPEESGRRNMRMETPLTVFLTEHRDLRYLAEDWMKKTADSYTIIATLIITIVFASTITLPGGNNGETGQAIYRNRLSFIVFVVSDVISMFTSTVSLLLLLSILTSSFNEMEFLYKLPKRLMHGLALLFMSVISMMIAFSTSVYIMFEQDKPWVLIPIVVLTSIPIVSFITLQLPLLVDLIASTYGHGIFRKSDLE